MLIQIVAIAGLATIELMALYKGINGKLLVLVAAIIGGITGYTLQINLMP